MPSVANHKTKYNSEYIDIKTSYIRRTLDEKGEIKMKWKAIKKPKNWLKTMGTESYGIDETVLFEIDEIDIYDIIDFKGKRYVCIHTSLKKQIASLDEISISSEKEKRLENNIVCPFCGCEDYDSCENYIDVDDYYCDNCRAVLEVNRAVSVTYDTVLKQAPRIRSVE